MEPKHAQDIEVFGIAPLFGLESDAPLPGFVLKGAGKTFLVDRADLLRGVYDESLAEDRQRLKRDIHVLQTETVMTKLKIA